MTHLQMIMYLHIKFYQYVMISLEVMSRTGLVTDFLQNLPLFLQNPIILCRFLKKLFLMTHYYMILHVHDEFELKWLIS